MLKTVKGKRKNSNLPAILLVSSLTLIAIFITALNRSKAVDLRVKADSTQTNDFCFVHMTDAHMDTSYSRTQMTEAITYFNNVLKPKFIIDTGDTNTNDNPSLSMSNFQKYGAIIKASIAKVYTVPGNHDRQGGMQYFYQYVSPGKWSFEYNGYRFIGFDIFAVDYPWLESQLKLAPLGKAIIFGHTPLLMPTGLDRTKLMNSGDAGKIKNLITVYKIPAYLSGHVHEPYVMSSPGNTYINVSAPAILKKRAFQYICLVNGEVKVTMMAIGQGVSPGQVVPTTANPTLAPTAKPVVPTTAITVAPTIRPTTVPTTVPTVAPTVRPTATSTPVGSSPIGKSCVVSGKTGICCKASFPPCVGRLVNSTTSAGCNPSGTYPQVAWCCDHCTN